MSRISLVEAYDNRDVIGQLVKLRQDVRQLYDIVENIDPSGDLTNFVTKTGDETIAGIKTFVGKIVADCDIIQLGNGYETHAEQVYSKDDYIIMRDGAIAGLAAGERSGFQVKLYNGVDDARLAVDRDGVARVGDVGDEQPLMTRDETADMTSGNILEWDGVNLKAITSGKSVSGLSNDISAVEGSVNALSSTVAGKVSGTGNVGSDLKPIKIVDGTAVAVANDLLDLSMSTQTVNGVKYFSAGLYIDDSDYMNAYLSGSVGVMRMRKDSVAQNVYGSLELRVDNSTGTVTLMLQKRRRSDDGYIGSTTLATI